MSCDYQEPMGIVADPGTIVSGRYMIERADRTADELQPLPDSVLITTDDFFRVLSHRFFLQRNGGEWVQTHRIFPLDPRYTIRFRISGKAVYALVLYNGSIIAIREVVDAAGRPCDPIPYVLHKSKGK